MDAIFVFYASAIYVIMAYFREIYPFLFLYECCLAAIKITDSLLSLFCRIFYFRFLMSIFIASFIDVCVVLYLHRIGSICFFYEHQYRLCLALISI